MRNALIQREQVTGREVHHPVWQVKPGYGRSAYAPRPCLPPCAHACEYLPSSRSAQCGDLRTLQASSNSAPWGATTIHHGAVGRVRWLG
jgi:hypothetical protein